MFTHLLRGCILWQGTVQGTKCKKQTQWKCGGFCRSCFNAQTGGGKAGGNKAGTPAAKARKTAAMAKVNAFVATLAQAAKVAKQPRTKATAGMLAAAGMSAAGKTAVDAPVSNPPSDSAPTKGPQVGREKTTAGEGGAGKGKGKYKAQPEQAQPAATSATAAASTSHSSTSSSSSSSHSTSLESDFVDLLQSFPDGSAADAAVRAHFGEARYAGCVEVIQGLLKRGDLQLLTQGPEGELVYKIVDGKYRGLSPEDLLVLQKVKGASQVWSVCLSVMINKQFFWDRIHQHCTWSCKSETKRTGLRLRGIEHNVVRLKHSQCFSKSLV